MDWPRFMAARTLLHEERIGRLIRQQEAEEDAGIARSIAGLRRDMAHGAR